MPDPSAPPRALSDVLRDSSSRLAQSGVSDPAVDAELLAGHVLGLPRGAVQAAVIRGDTIPAAEVEAMEQLVSRRVTREPLQHITGTAPFRHLELRVGPGVFVPRPETEVVVEAVLARLTGSERPRVVD